MVGSGGDLYKGEDPIALTVYVKALIHDLDMYIIYSSAELLGFPVWNFCSLERGNIILTQKISFIFTFLVMTLEMVEIL